MNIKERLKKPNYLLPHENTELELMLTGQKKLALFSADNGLTAEDVGDAGFEKYVDDGTIIMYTINNTEFNYQTRIYCLPTEEWRAKIVLLMRDPDCSPFINKLFTGKDLHRLDGAILGYPKKSIEEFINNLG